jgi:gluconokinase
VIILVMGVSGSGKSTVGGLIAERLGWPLIDADRFHSPENIRRMSAGIPLTDADRLPWLRAVRSELDRLAAAGTSVVLACSALKRSYRAILSDDLSTEFRIVFLRGDRDTIRVRMGSREHFMKPHMLASQFADLEEPAEDEAVILDIHDAPHDLAARAIRLLGLCPGDQSACSPASRGG